MTVSAHTLLQRLADAWNARDLDALAALFTTDCVYIDMALGVSHSGHAGIRAFASDVYRTMPDFTLSFPLGFRADDQMASEWIITATWNGLFEGSDRTGTPIRFTGLSRYELEGDLIRRNIDCWDSSALARDIGGAVHVTFP